jgi:parallel beta-helix repeat protein
MRKVGPVISLLIFLSTFHLALVILPENAGADTLFVGRSGPGNYTTIQNAVDDAHPGDTIYVYSGTYYENITVSKPLSLVGEDRNTTTVNGSRDGNIVHITADWVNFTGFTITNGSSSFWGTTGIGLNQVQNCRIADNIVSGNYSGISLRDSDNNMLAGNHVYSDNARGIYLSKSHNNIITQNKLSCNHSCIYIFLSKNTVVASNVMKKGGVSISGYSLEHWNSHAIDTSNIVNGKPLYYWKNVVGGTVPLGAGQVILANCSIVVVENQNTGNTSAGIQLGFSSNNTVANNRGVSISLEFSTDNVVTRNSGSSYAISISGASERNTVANNTISNNGVINIYSSLRNVIVNNTVSNSGHGISVHYARYNIISNNHIFSNNYGFYIVHSTYNLIVNNNVTGNVHGISLPHKFYWIGPMNFGNMIYHNNFINNTNQASDSGGNHWDNGYPTGGNYWSSYAGSDRKRGPDQKLPGSDGIGDMPVEVPITGAVVYGEPITIEDRFPLMSPFVAPSWPPDGQSPICMITTPVSGDNVLGILKIGGVAVDFQGTIEKVEIKIDGSVWTQVNETSSLSLMWDIRWSHNWNTRAVSNGRHTICARSYDGTSYSTETCVVVFVNNPQPLWVIVIALAGVLVSILSITYILIRRRKKQKEEGRSETPSERYEDSSGEDKV